MLKHKLQDFQDQLSSREKPSISLRKAANTPGYYQKQEFHASETNMVAHGIPKKVAPPVNAPSNEKVVHKSNRRQSEGLNANTNTDKENIRTSKPKALQLQDPSLEKAKSTIKTNKTDDESDRGPVEEVFESRVLDNRKTLRTEEGSDDEATIVNPIKNLIFENKNSMHPKIEERLPTSSSIRENASVSTKAVLKPVTNSKLIEQNPDMGPMMSSSIRVDSGSNRANLINAGNPRGVEYMNENNTLVKRVSKEINNEIQKIKRTLSSASKSPGRNIYENTPEKGKETSSSAKKMMEFSGAKNTKMNLELEKVDGPFNNRANSLIPIQDYKGDKKDMPYYSFHEESLFKSDDSYKRDYPSSQNEESQSAVAQTFSPKVEGLSPKFYHNFVSKKVTSDKSFGQVKRESVNTNTYASGTGNTISASNTLGSTSGNNNNSQTNNNQKGKAQGTINDIEGLNTRDSKANDSRPSFNHKSKHSKQDIYDFYIDLLRKIELIKFTVNFTNLTGNDEEREFLEEAQKTDKKPNGAFTVEIDNIKLNDELDNECYRVLCARYGKEYFILLKKIFNMYSIEKKETRVLGVRQLVKISKDFKFCERIPACTRTELELIFTKRVPSKYANFQDFIEILFKVNKLNNKNSSDSDGVFKTFLDEFMVQRFKELSIKVYEFNLDRIQVFYQSYNPYENPSVCLLYECDNLTKHLFSIYESIDIKRSTNSFVTQKNFLKFCNDYGIIPLLCNNSQISKIFRIFQKGNQEIIGFTGFVMLLCCVAHIGLATHGDKYKGFYKKIYKLFELLMQVNNHISDTLVISNLKKSKD